MSFNKEQMLEIYQTNLQRYEGPQWQDIFALYEAQPNYATLTYHNVDHVKSVMALADLMAKLEPLPKELNVHFITARTALAYHDLGHSGHNDAHVGADGKDNIDRAIAMTAEHRTDSPNQLVLDYIAATRYPMFEGLPGETNETVVNLIRDADMLWGLLPGNAEQSMLGLWLEQVASGAVEDKPCDIIALLTRQINFIGDYQPLSRGGRLFKHAFWVKSTEAWSLVALEFLRQIEAAKAVEEMSDSDLLRLQAAIREQLPRPE